MQLAIVLNMFSCRWYCAKWFADLAWTAVGRNGEWCWTVAADFVHATITERCPAAGDWKVRTASSL